MTDTPIEARKTAAALATYVKADAGDSAYVADCWAEAVQLVADYVGAVQLPAPVLDRAILEVGSELYHRRQAPNGVAQFTGLDGSPIRIARDPMVSAYPILARHLGPGIA